jgi:cysteinyl-tRNA synthetase
MSKNSDRKIYVYNEITRQKEEFIPVTKGEKKIKMYVCGPTVYEFFHVGNARCFVVFDFIRRFFEYLGYDVDYVFNFTDIDDKMIRKAAEEKTSVKEVAEKYIAEYKKDAEGLGIHPATVHPRATEHIGEIIDIIKILIEKSHAYPAKKDINGNSDVYFSARSFKEYGKLSKIDTDELESGARVEIGEDKRDALDFALWKAKKEGEPFWESPWGEGRPGWHIECSAMAKKYLGDTMDFHCGGRDLAFPHHQNEIAQSECAYGKPMANFWLHNGMINIDSKKMSKSKNNFFTTREISEEYGYMPIRYFVLASTYRTPINFSETTIRSAKSSLDRIFECGENIDFLLKTADTEQNPEDEKTIQTLFSYKDKLIDALCDDFNTADAISVLFDFIREANTAMINASIAPSKKLLGAVKSLYSEFCGLFGFAPEADLNKEQSGLTEEYINGQIEKRTAAKKAKDFKTADDIRNAHKEQGVILEDTPTGTKYKKV